MEQFKIQQETEMLEFKTELENCIEAIKQKKNYEIKVMDEMKKEEIKALKLQFLDLNKQSEESAELYIDKMELIEKANQGNLAKMEEIHQQKALSQEE